MKRELRVIYMGTPEFAVPSVDILVKNGVNVVAIITAPDKPAGRGNKKQKLPLKDYAIENNIPLLQPTNLKNPDFLEELRSFNANLQIVVAFRMLPEAVWDMPEIGTFNLHASLLPQYRGAAPINWAVMNGETETGCTTFFLKHKIDTGDVIMQCKEPIHPEDNVGTLYERLMNNGAQLVLDTVRKIENDEVELSPQIETSELKEAPKIFKDTCEINWDQPSEQIHNFVRGLSPYPCAWTTLLDKTCKIYATEIVKELPENSTQETTPYITDHKKYLLFPTQNGYISIKELQLQGKKRMDIEAFLRGAKL